MTLRMLRLLGSHRSHASEDAPVQHDASHDGPCVTECPAGSMPTSTAAANLCPGSPVSCFTKPPTLLHVTDDCTALHCAPQPRGLRCSDVPDNSCIVATAGMQ